MHMTLEIDSSDDSPPVYLQDSYPATIVPEFLSNCARQGVRTVVAHDFNMLSSTFVSH